jgi:signal transduction histidine kinase/ligand-binding sensor domain-containing protein
MLHDSRGFLWVCTRDGLSRFDGSRFVTYQVGDGSAPGVEQFVETRDGIYWIATTAGLYRFDPAVPATFTTKSEQRPTLPARYVDASRGFFFADRDGTLWYGYDGLFRRYEDGQALASERIELNLPRQQGPALNIFRMIQTRDGSLWLFTTWGLVRRCPDGREVFYQMDDGQMNPLTSLVEDADGKIWASRRRGLYIINPGTADEIPANSVTLVKVDQRQRLVKSSTTHVEMPTGVGEIIKYNVGDGFLPEMVTAVYQTADKHIWILSGDNLVEVSAHDLQIHPHLQVTSRATSDLMEDSTGALWIANSAGLFCINRSGLTSYGGTDGMAEPYARTINETRDGKIYVVGTGYRLGFFETQRFRSVRPQLPENAASAWTSNMGFQDSRGQWWFLTQGKLHRFAAVKDFGALASTAPLRVYDQRDGLTGTHMFHIFEDSRANLWLSTEVPNGLSRWNASTDQFEPLTQAQGFPADKAASAFAEDASGNLWFGFYQGGLVRYTEGRFKEFTVADGIPRGLITSLYIDRRGQLWIGSAQEGVARVAQPAADHPQFEKLTTENGLASNNVRAITGDLYDNVYFGTARGLDRVSPEASHFKHYSISDGLAGDFVTAAFRDRGGNLWFGTPSGVSRLIPQPDAKESAPVVLIGDVRVAGERRPVPMLGSANLPAIKLAHSQNNMQIDFFGIDFRARENLRYQYLLEGADRDWSALTLQRSVTFANIAPGSYRFMVRAVGTDGTVSNHPAMLSFTILPPIWQRWWFLTLAALVMIAIAYTLYRYRLAQLLRVERVRTRIATDLHDDIGASLSRVAILSEVVKQQTASGDGHESAGLLTEIADSARGLVDSMSDIVWSIDPRRDDVQSVVRRIRQFASDVLETKEIEWELVVPPEVERLKLGPDERQHLFLIFKEAINNVVRHGEGAEYVSMSMRIDGRQLVGEVRDDGCGFMPQGPDVESAKGRGGNGLPNMRGRATQLRGELEVASAPNAGTRLTLRMPIK